MAINIKKFIALTGFSYDKKARSFYGNFHGIPCSIDYSNDNYYLNMKFYVRNNTLIENGVEDTFIADMQSSLTEIKNSHKKSLVQKCYYESYAIIANLYIFNSKTEKIIEFMNDIQVLCRDKNLVECCGKCGIQTQTDYYTINQMSSSLCESCRQEVVSNLSQNELRRAEVQPNVAFGILGALIGAIVLFALTFVCYKLGYIVYIVGILGVVVAMNLYNKFSGKITYFGAVLTIVICLVSSVISGVFCYAKDLSDLYRDEIAEYNEYVDELNWIKTSSLEEYNEYYDESKDVMIEYYEVYIAEYKTYLEEYKGEESIFYCMIHINDVIKNYDNAKDMRAGLIELIIINIITVLIGGITSFKGFVKSAAGKFEVRRLA